LLRRIRKRADQQRRRFHVGKHAKYEPIRFGADVEIGVIQKVLSDVTAATGELGPCTCGRIRHLALALGSKVCDWLIGEFPERPVFGEPLEVGRLELCLDNCRRRQSQGDSQQNPASAPVSNGSEECDAPDDNVERAMCIGISAIEYAIPETCVNLEELARSGRLETAADRLREFGFNGARISTKPAEVLAHEALSRLFATTGQTPEAVGALFHAGAIPASHVVSASHSHVIEGFHYPAARLQYEFGLLNAMAVGVGQVGCAGLMTAIRLAIDFLKGSPETRAAICSSADVLPADAPREFIYNIVSDGACAVLVERHSARNHILAYRQITKGYYWDAASLKNEIVAAYFPTAQHLVRMTLADACLDPADIDWVIPHNVSLRSWEILLRLLDIPRERVFLDNIATKGHVIAADNFINLKDAADRGLLKPGDRLLLFTFGFGANWACMVLEH